MHFKDNYYPFYNWDVCTVWCPVVMGLLFNTPQMKYVFCPTEGKQKIVSNLGWIFLKADINEKKINEKSDDLFAFLLATNCQNLVFTDERSAMSGSSIDIFWGFRNFTIQNTTKYVYLFVLWVFRMARGLGVGFLSEFSRIF